MIVKVLLSLSVVLVLSTNGYSQTPNYNHLTSWYMHPNKFSNLLDGYDLDIAVIDKDLNVDSIIDITNNSTTNTGVDVFFVHPTILTSFPSIPDTISISDQPSTLISATILAQGGLLGKYGRFFAPKYRQSNAPSFNDTTFSDSTRAASLTITYSDVRAAFMTYLNNFNNGNKIILAGHSQGSYLLGMLLRDVFDNNETLRSQLVIASLGGMAYVYGEPGSYKGGWWQNIPLCSIDNECACIHNWTTFKEDQIIPLASQALPAFNENLVDSGLVYRNINLSSDWTIQDSLFYSSQSSPLRYYISPDAQYNLSGGKNFIAFDSLYTARFKRNDNTHAVLAVDYTSIPGDQRPNDLLAQENHSNYANWGFHQKDYHIYLWALMEQIDAKLVSCSYSTVNEIDEKYNLVIYPNPSHGKFRLLFNNEYDDEIKVYNSYGRLIKSYYLKGVELELDIHEKGLYLIQTKYGIKKVVVEN